MMKEPIDKQAEYGVLAGMMNDAGAYYDAGNTVSADCFTDDETVRLFNWLVAKGEPKSAAAVLKNVTGAKEKALIRTIDAAYTGKDGFAEDLHRLKDTYLKRQIYYMTQKVMTRLENENADQLIGMMEREISQMYFDDQDENIIDPAERAVLAYQEALEKFDNPDKFKGIPFTAVWKGARVGFPSLDTVFNGANGGDLIMLAAKTGEGKTALGMNLARLFSLYQPHYGYYMNTEMRVDEMESRLLAPIAGVASREMFYGRYEGTADDIKKKMTNVSAAYEQYRKCHMYLSRIPSLPLHKAKGLAKQVRVKYGRVDYLIIDYVGRMDLSDKDRNMQHWDVMYEITKQLKELAMELNVPVFMLAQRNQAGEVEGAKKMMNECDGVLFFEPCTEEDAEYIQKTFLDAKKRDAVNYKITKKKVRRDDNPYPIYCNFDKQMQFINEIPVR